MNVPEIQLYLADTWHVRKTSNERFEAWAYAWVGGQALARYILDNPEIVAGKTVVDLASGSGIVAIAAKLAGAKRVIAIDDYDPAIEVMKLNAEANGVEIEIEQQDMYEYTSDADLFLFGDPFFDVRALYHAKKTFNKVLVGCPVRFPHYQDYMTNIVMTYHMHTKFDDASEYDVDVWWLNE